MHEANRMKRLPPYLFTVVDNIKAEVRAQGVDVIDLSMGNPEIPPPPFVVQALRDALKKKDIHRYSKFDGEVERQFRRAIAGWYKRRFNVELNPDKEILPLLGSKEGIAHLALTYMNNDDLALVPSPAYPVHFNGIIMAGGILYNVPLREEKGYLPDFSEIPREAARLSKLMFLSYPHNPTTATCDLDFYERAVHWAKDKNIILASDIAYSEFVFSGPKARSILEVKAARDFAIEFHTFSKSYCMAGWRLGFAVGNANIIGALAKTKSYVDFGIFRALQVAGTRALTGPQDFTRKIVAMYKKRSAFFCRGLRKIGWGNFKDPKATFYCYTRLPRRYSALTSLEFAELVLREAGVALSPGTGFGEYGEGYVRFALVEPEERLQEGFKRLKRLLEMED